MSAQPGYLIRSLRRDLVQAEALSVRYPEITRETPVKVPRGFDFRRVEGTGRYDHRHLEIHPVSFDAEGNRIETRVRDHWGRRRRADYRDGAFSSADAAGVKTVLRRLRDQEAVLLDACDAEIARLQEQLSLARQARKEALSEAWRKANVVRLAEVTAIAVEKLS